MRKLRCRRRSLRCRRSWASYLSSRASHTSKHLKYPLYVIFRFLYCLWFLSIDQILFIIYLDENTKLSEKISTLSEELSKRLREAELLQQETEAELLQQVATTILLYIIWYSRHVTNKARMRQSMYIDPSSSSGHCIFYAILCSLNFFFTYIGWRGAITVTF